MTDDHLHDGHDEPGDLPDEPLEPSLLAAAREYHRPPEPPREAMWRAIQAERRVERARRPAAAPLATLGHGRGGGPGAGHRHRPPVEPQRTARAGIRGRYRAAPAGERDRLPAGDARAPRPIGGVPHALPYLAAERRAGAARLGVRPASSWPRTGCCSTRRRRRTGGPGCCCRTWSWSSRRSRSSRPTRRPETATLIREGMDRGGVLSRLRTDVPAGTTPTRGDL